MNSEELSKVVVLGMQEKKGEDIVVMDLRKVKNAIADYFIICSGTSDTHIDAISESIEKEVHNINRENPWHREGKDNKEWVLLDYVSVVSHIFKKDRREFYSLEELWGDAIVTEVASETESKTLYK